MKKRASLPAVSSHRASSLWVEREVRDWMAQQVAKRDADKPDDVTARCNEQLVKPAPSAASSGRGACGRHETAER